MNKEIKHFVILGGAGYLGVDLVKKIVSQHNSKVTIVTRNKSKQILFRGYKNVFFKSSTKDIINETIFIFNLAYGLDVSYKRTKKLNDLIIQSIDVLCSNNHVKSLIHISSIVLSEDNNDLVPKLDKTDAYKYAKSIAELGVNKIHRKYNIPTLVVRSGNILGPGSIWAIKICKCLLGQKPISTKSNDFFSNVTYIGNLTTFLSNKSLKVYSDFEIINFNEFGSLAWNEIIEIFAKEIGIQPKVWNTSNIKDFEVSFSNDLKNAMRQMFKIAIIKIYKGPISNKFIDKLLDKFGITKLDQKAKSNIKSLDNDPYPDAQEFALLKVFMNSNNIKNSLSEREVKALPYDFSKVSDELVKWLRIAGYSSLK